ncbi:MAG: hypothetical protein ACRDZ0_04930 [Acidimicrobiales bacterium]
MPDKRQTSKQRRAARNRASRDALAARRTNAVISGPTSASSHGSRAGSTSSESATTASATTGRGGGLLGGRGNRRPGDLAVMLALGLAIVSAIAVLFQRVDVDDRGEPLPAAFKGVAIIAIEATGREVPDASASLIDAYGAGILFAVALPVAVAAFAFWANRRPNRSRVLTFSMIAMAVGVLFSPGIGTFFFPSLIALAVGTYQVRKADLPARVAERAAPTRERGAIDAESEELEDEPIDDGVDAATGDGGGDTDGIGDQSAEAAGDEAAGDEAADPLAELEAELDAEERSRRGGGGGPSRGSTPEE